MKRHDSNEVQDFRKMEWVDADVAQELYDSLSGFVEAVDEDVIRVRPSDRDTLLSLLERANEALNKADKE